MQMQHAHVPSFHVMCTLLASLLLNQGSNTRASHVRVVPPSLKPGAASGSFRWFRFIVIAFLHTWSRGDLHGKLAAAAVNRNVFHNSSLRDLGEEPKNLVGRPNRQSRLAAAGPCLGLTYRRRQPSCLRPAGGECRSTAAWRGMGTRMRCSGSASSSRTSRSPGG